MRINWMIWNTHSIPYPTWEMAYQPYQLPSSVPVPVHMNKRNGQIHGNKIEKRDEQTIDLYIFALLEFLVCTQIHLNEL